MNIREIGNIAQACLASADDENSLSKGGVRVYTAISVGAQRASHVLFEKLPSLIAGHLAPVDFFEAEFPGTTAPGSLNVISCALHLNPVIVEENASETRFPSRTWYEARHRFDLIIPLFLEHLGKILPGVRMVVPGRSARYRADLSKKVPVSNWSERHVAFACGLGSFGLHGAFITPMGCTHRLISVIMEGVLEGYAEPGDDPFRDCLHFRDGSCGECIARCPVEAIAPGTHSIERCCGHEQGACRVKSAEIFGPEVAACGLCMCGVPCSTSSP